MGESTANPTIDAATVASHLTEVRKQHQEPRKQLNPKTPFTARQEKAFENAQKRAELQEDLNAEWAMQVERANVLAEKHGIKPQEMQRRVQHTPDGEKTRLQELQALAKQNNYADLDDETKNELKNVLLQARAIRKTTTRNRGTAVIHDVRATTARVFNELSNLNDRCNMASFCLVVRTAPTNATNPHYFIDADVRAFIETTFNTTAEEFAVLFESFMVGRVRAVAQTSTAKKLAGKGKIRTIVRDALRAITSDPTAEMSWKQYEERVVNAYSVHLKNWPTGVAFNPDSMSSRDVRIVLAALEDGVCEWAALESEELRERQADIRRRIAAGELKVKETKRRSDAGVPRGPYKKAGKRVATSNNQSDDEQHPPTKKHKTASPISPATIDDSDEEEGSDGDSGTGTA